MSDKRRIPIEERVIFALDVPTADEAKEWVERLGPEVGFFKVGLQLFLGAGFSIVDWIVERGYKVMLDLKFFDVPKTVELAVRQLHGHGITYATVHGNAPILEAACRAKGDIKILAVTVLTSFGEEDLRQMGLSGTIEDLVCIRAQRALELGCDGVVSSPLEASMLRDRFGKKFFVVTPGIRPGKNREVEQDDQVRIATAREAIESGADHVVVGRPIKTAANPLAVVRSIRAEIVQGNKGT